MNLNYSKASIPDPGRTQRLAVFIMLPFLGLAVFALLFQFILANGPAGGLDQAGIHGNTLVVAKPLAFELTQDLGVDGICCDPKSLWAHTSAASDPGWAPPWQ